MLARVAWRAPAKAAVCLADATVQAEAVLLAAGSVRVLRAALVAVKAGPARQARALPVHRVAADAVLRIAGAGCLAVEAVKAVGTEAFRAAIPGEAVFAQTSAVGREAAGARGAVARLGTVLPEAVHGALLLAPIPGVTRSAMTLPSESVAEAAIVATTFQGAVATVQLGPVFPGGQRQAPVWGLQGAPWHWQLSWQAGP